MCRCNISKGVRCYEKRSTNFKRIFPKTALSRLRTSKQHSTAQSGPISMNYSSFLSIKYPLSNCIKISLSMSGDISLILIYGITYCNETYHNQSLPGPHDTDDILKVISSNLKIIDRFSGRGLQIDSLLLTTIQFSNSSPLIHANP